MVGKKIRSLFPLFSRCNNSDTFIYFDTAATAHKPQAVIDAMVDFYTNCNANVGRGVYDLSERATQIYEDCRDAVAAFINAADRSEVILNPGTTAGTNFVADTWGMQNIKAGDEIVVTRVEHHANILPWQRLAKRMGATLKFIDIDKETFSVNFPADGVITNKTKLVAITHSSNVLGPIWNKGQLEQVIAAAHAVGAKVLLDAAQSSPHHKIDVQQLDADFLVFSAHKIMGPTGIGVLFIKQDLHDDLEPYQVGGSMVYEASFDHATWQKAPAKFEAGTPPIAQAAGLKAAIEFINEHIDFDELNKHESGLCNQLLDGLQQIDGLRILGNIEQLRKHGHLVSFAVSGLHSHDLASYLASKGIAIRVGHHCAQPLAKYLDVDSSVRASFYVYNTSQEVERFLQEVKAGIELLRTL